MTRLQRIEQIARKNPADITKADKDYIISVCKKMSIEFTPNPRCGMCYSDQAIIIRKAIKDASAASGKTARQYILKDGVDVIFMGQRINNDTLTDEMAKDILAKGFATYLFV